MRRSYLVQYSHKNSTLTIGLIYRSPNIRQEDDEKLHNAIKEISKRECVIMGDFNHGHIQWKSLESVGRDDQQFFTSNTGLFPYTTCFRTNERWKCVGFSILLSKRIS